MPRKKDGISQDRVDDCPVGTYISLGQVRPQGSARRAFSFSASIPARRAPHPTLSSKRERVSTDAVAAGALYQLRALGRAPFSRLREKAADEGLSASAIVRIYLSHNKGALHRCPRLDTSRTGDESKSERRGKALSRRVQLSSRINEKYALRRRSRRSARGNSRTGRLLRAAHGGQDRRPFREGTS